LTIGKPDRFVGQAGALEVTADAPNALVTSLVVMLEQNGRSIPLFSLDGPQTASVTRVDRNRLVITRPLGKQSVPELQSGAAKIVVTASRPSFLKLRQLRSTASKDFQVRLEPPRIAVLSTHHYVNHGGSEMVVYKATPTTCLRRGSATWLRASPPRAPASKAQTRRSRWRSSRWHDQPLNAPSPPLRATRPATGEGRLRRQRLRKPFKKSRRIDDKFINRVVPGSSSIRPS
jgi:hypothetical protein